MKIFFNLFILGVAITLNQVLADNSKVADVVIVDDSALETPVTAMAWYAYGAARSKYLKCKDYTYSYEEELNGREALIKFWKEHKRGKNKYLDTLLEISDAGFLPEYVKYYYFNSSSDNDSLNRKEQDFNSWRIKNLSEHNPINYVRVEINKSACKDA